MRTRGLSRLAKQGNLVFLSHTHIFRGGAEKSLLALVESVIDQGYAAHAIVPHTGRLSALLEALGANTYRISFPLWVKGWRNTSQPSVARAAVNQISELLIRLSPLCCITNTITAPWLAYAACRAGFGHAWILREYGDSDHGICFWQSKREIISLVTLLSDKVFANSLALKRHYESFPGSGDIDVLYPPVRPLLPEKQDLKPEFLDSADVTLACIGTISEGKGQLEAVKAVGRLRQLGLNVQLLLAGEASDRRYLKVLKQLVSDQGLAEFIDLVGYQRDPTGVMSCADIVLVCSRSEAFGRVAIESIMLGTPVIGARSGGTQEILESHGDTFLYDPGDHLDLASKIVRFLHHPQTGCRDFHALRSEVRKRYAMNTVTQPLFNYLEGLASMYTCDIQALETLDSLLADQEDFPGIQFINALQGLRSSLTRR